MSMEWSELIREVEATSGISIRRDVPKDVVTTFSLGASLPLLIEPKTVSSAHQLLSLLNSRREEFFVLGLGSNVILPDEPLGHPVLRLGAEFVAWGLSSKPPTNEQMISYLRGERPSVWASCEQEDFSQIGASVYLFSLAGTPLIGLSRKVSALGLSGLEFAAGIPGSLGGASVMNAGAHGSSISDISEALVISTPEAELRVLGREELSFSYREARLPQGSLVLAALLKLTVLGRDETLGKRRSCLDYRKKTQPLTLPSAGSVFRNPADSRDFLERFSARFSGKMPSAGRLIEEVGLKGERRGGVAFSELHANWLVKVAPEARASEALWLVEEARRRVSEEFGIVLKPEIKFW